MVVVVDRLGVAGASLLDFYNYAFVRQFVRQVYYVMSKKRNSDAKILVQQQ